MRILNYHFKGLNINVSRNSFLHSINLGAWCENILITTESSGFKVTNLRNLGTHLNSMDTEDCSPGTVLVLEFKV